jgi:leucyl aminopeptidase (aminopeptidase T)
MLPRRRLPLLGLALVWAGCQQAPQTDTATPAAEISPPAAPVDYAALSERLVTQVAGIAEGDRVLITGGAKDLQLLEDLAVQVRKAGAFPLITVGSENLTRRLVVDVPEQYDSQPDQLGLAMVNVFNVIVSVDYATAPDLLADVPPARMAKRAQASSGVEAAAMKKGVRMINLGNSMIPSPANATRLGLTEDELMKVFWAGVNADPAAITAKGEALKQALAAGSTLHITDPNGTDLTVHVEKRPVLISDGAISAEDKQKGGTAAFVWLPAGEVYLAPVPGTAQGKVVVDRQPFQGKEVQGLTLTFAGGKLTDMTATSGIEPLKAQYDAAGAGKENFAFVDFGINPAVASSSGARIRTWVAAGNVSVGLGNNLWAGGTVDAPYGLSLHLTNATVTLDGKPIVENGALIVN